jgi:prephenate dehydrogenase
VAPIVVLAAPPRANLTLLRRLGPIAPPHVVFTDLGSVKSPIAALARRLRLERFVGGHPMTGSERAGFAASSADLFRGHPWILTPDGCEAQALSAVRRLARSAGARPFSMPPGEHDRVMAFVSHMPQLLSWAIDGAARNDAVTLRHLHLAGPGFRDMTRLARSSRSLWREILAQNQSEIARAMAALARALKRRV